MARIFKPAQTVFSTVRRSWQRFIPARPAGRIRRDVNPAFETFRARRGARTHLAPRHR